MKHSLLFQCLCAALCGWFLSLDSANAQGSAFTYQGRLLDSNGVAVTGNYDLQFKLHPASSGTNQVGATLTNAPTAISNGLFTVTLDFGAPVFDGTARWLEIGVRTNGSVTAYAILNPTQPLTATPYAVLAGNAANFAGTVADNQLSTNVALFNAGGHFTQPVIFDNASGSFSGTVNGTLSGTFSGAIVASGSLNGSFTGTGTGTFTGTNNGTFFGNGAGITNLNVTNIVGVIQSNFNWQVMQSTSQQGQNANNYLNTNSLLTTLTLPNNPAVGNTLRFASSGAAGWVLAQNTGQSILTGNLGLPAGRAWTPTAGSVGPSVAWKGIASSSDGLKLVAVVNSGFIYTSADGGTTWTARATNSTWTAVASSTDGTHLAAAPSGLQISTSTNSGVTWVSHGASHFWSCIASSADGTKLAAAENGGDIYTSVDSGSNWTARAGALAWVSIASSADGTKLAAAVNVGNIYTSTDSGSNWTARATGLGSLSWTAITSSSDGTKLAAVVNGGNIYTSGDSGSNWTLRGTTAAWQTITSSGDGVNLAAGINGGVLYSSFDSGQTWFSRTSTNLSWFGSAFSTDGTRVAATVNVGQIFTSLSATTIGTSGSLSGNQYSSTELQYIGNGQWMPIGAIGTFTGN